MSTNEFNRWHDSVYANALREAAEAFAMGEGLEAFAVANATDDEGAVLATSKWLDARADRIERGGAAMIEATERAWWWELTGGGYRFQPGEPWRSESPNGVAREGVTGSIEFRQWAVTHYSAIPVGLAPLAVGDVITECTPDNLPPEGVGLVNGEGDLCQIRQGRALWAVPAVSYGWEILNDATPFTVIYVPKAGGDDD